MLEIVALYFLTRHNGRLAAQKGLTPLTWKINTIFAWLGGEMIGVFAGVQFFGINNILAIMLVALPCAFAGFHLVKHTLEQKPDAQRDDRSQSQAE